jgi:hypothetical protein
MLEPTTTEHTPLAVAALAGHVSCAPRVAPDGYRTMRTAAVPAPRTADRRTRPVEFGIWNRPRRLVGFVT